MIQITPQMRILLAVEPVDFRNHSEIAGLVARLDGSNRIPATAHALDEVLIMASGGTVDQIDRIGPELDVPQGAGFGENAAAIDLHPPLVAPERAALRIRMIGVTERHAQPVLIAELARPVVDVVRQVVMAIISRKGTFAAFRSDGRTSPIGNVEMMNTPVHNEADTKIADQIPVGPGPEASVVRTLRGRAQIHVEIETRRDRFRGRRLLIRAAHVLCDLFFLLDGEAVWLS